ncbi:hypothetical protein BK659_13780 [Pseudomonas brassicacearum]|uniref:RiboL-PSP-HEPN domain-containing protein n=2 Tax=Pseudomonas brassicacearum TaxID=930166 RepID=A0A423H5I5_9PSED|nr:hypothetical protein BK659_13780 [Pseudomonas brassicacearum]
MSSFALILSHFEKYQRSLFFEIFEVVGFMEGFNDVDLSKRLEKVGCVLSLQRIISGRGDPREVGHIIADALPGWHNPERVNSYFKIFFSDLNFYSKAMVTELEMMWQLRHSIVHTAGVVSREDAMKAPELRGLRDKGLVFSEGFINEVGRRFHMIVQLSLQQLEQAVRKAITPSLEDPEDLIEPLIRFESPRSTWFEAGN